MPARRRAMAAHEARATSGATAAPATKLGDSLPDRAQQESIEALTERCGFPPTTTTRFDRASRTPRLITVLSPRGTRLEVSVRDRVRLARPEVRADRRRRSARSAPPSIRRCCSATSTIPRPGTGLRGHDDRAASPRLLTLLALGVVHPDEPAARSAAGEHAVESRLQRVPARCKLPFPCSLRAHRPCRRKSISCTSSSRPSSAFFVVLVALARGGLRAQVSAGGIRTMWAPTFTGSLILELDVDLHPVRAGDGDVLLGR